MIVITGGAGLVSTQQGGHAQLAAGEEVADLDLTERDGGGRHGPVEQS